MRKNDTIAIARIFAVAIAISTAGCDIDILSDEATPSEAETSSGASSSEGDPAEAGVTSSESSTTLPEDATEDTDSSGSDCDTGGGLDTGWDGSELTEDEAQLCADYCEIAPSCIPGDVYPWNFCQSDCESRLLNELECNDAYTQYVACVVAAGECGAEACAEPLAVLAACDEQLGCGYGSQSDGSQCLFGMQCGGKTWSVACEDDETCTCLVDGEVTGTCSSTDWGMICDEAALVEECCGWSLPGEHSLPSGT